MANMERMRAKAGGSTFILPGVGEAARYWIDQHEREALVVWIDPGTYAADLIFVEEDPDNDLAPNSGVVRFHRRVPWCEAIVTPGEDVSERELPPTDVACWDNYGTVR